MNVRNFTKEEKEYIIESYCKNNKSINQIRIDLKCRDTKVSNFLKENNIPIVNKQNISKINENVFDKIDTEEKAYWLGFIFADGTIRSMSDDKKNFYQFELSLSIKDLEHLEKFKEFISWKNDIYIDSCRCRVVFNNKYFWNILNNYGCVPNKSLILQFPNETIFEHKDLIKHFIRGYCDGDGSLTYKTSDHLVASLSILGTTEFLIKMQNYLPLKQVYKMYQPNKEKNTFEFKLSNEVAFKIMYYLYENSNIYLTRKQNKYLEFCRLYEESYKLLLTNIGENCNVNPEINSEIA